MIAVRYLRYPAFEITSLKRKPSTSGLTAIQYTTTNCRMQPSLIQFLVIRDHFAHIGNAAALHTQVTSLIPLPYNMLVV